MMHVIDLYFLKVNTKYRIEIKFMKFNNTKEREERWR